MQAMDVTVSAGNASRVIDVSVMLPVSKSLVARQIIVSALCGKRLSVPDGWMCDDIAAMQRVVSSGGGLVDVGASGTALRFGLAYLSLQEGEFLLDGTERLRQRPVKELVEALRCLGADISCIGGEGFAPLRVRGRVMSGRQVCIDVSRSSQFVSALLLIAPMLKGGLEIVLQGDVRSRPYIDMTLSVMRDCGIKIEESADGRIIKVPCSHYDAGGLRPAEADWSAAAYWYAIAALAGNAAVRLPHLQCGSVQGDAVVSEIYERFGVVTEFRDGGIIVSHRRGHPLPASFDFDFRDNPDLAQCVAVTCICLKVPFVLRGLDSLVFKESDRINATASVLAGMGYGVHTNGRSFMSWDGKACAGGGNLSVKTFGDHRMAMSFAPLCMMGRDVLIEDAGVVSKSYPGFWTDLARAGFSVEPC